jgi:hypothetical protein
MAEHLDRGAERRRLFISHPIGCLVGRKSRCIDPPYMPGSFGAGRTVWWRKPLICPSAKVIILSRMEHATPRRSVLLGPFHKPFTSETFLPERSFRERLAQAVIRTGLERVPREIQMYASHHFPPLLSIRRGKWLGIQREGAGARAGQAKSISTPKNAILLRISVYLPSKKFRYKNYINIIFLICQYYI